MLRRNLLKAFTAIIPVFLLPAIKLQGNEVKPHRTLIEIKSDGNCNKRTYDQNEKQLTYENSEGFWSKNTYDQNGNQLTYENSNGFWSKNTYDQNGKKLTFEDSNGFWQRHSYDQYGDEIASSYTDSKGRTLQQMWSEY